MKNPNRYGSITKLSGNRRKPFWVREGVTGQQKTIGFAETKEKALMLLAKYNHCPCCHNGQVIMRVVPNSVIPLRIIDNGQIREGAPEFVCKKCGKKLELGAFLNKYGYRIMFDCRTREFRLSK